MKRRKKAAPKRACRRTTRTVGRRPARRTTRKTTRAKTVARVKKPKYKVGDFVYSSLNPTEKRQINEVKAPKRAGTVVKYRLTLSDAKGRPKNSKWLAEASIRKTKKS